MPTVEPLILGGHQIDCTSCGKTIYSFNSCGDTNCPQCQNIKKQLWIDKMAYHLLPIKHFHIVFTIPKELRDWFFYNQRACYQLLFQVAWKTIAAMAGDGVTGMVATMHTWGSNLSYHPHVHCIVPAGCFEKGKWVYRQGSNDRFFCDATQLRQTYKRLFLQHFLELVEYGDDFTWKAIPMDKDERLFEKLRQDLRQACRKKWTVRIENPVLGTEQIIQYLARYVRRVAITNARITCVTANKVSIQYNQYQLQQPGKPAPKASICFDGPAFIDRFAQHIPPSGFHKVRYYGCYAFSAKHLKATIYQTLTQQALPTYQPPSTSQIVRQLLGHDPDVCTTCGSIGTLVTSPLTQDASKAYYLTPTPVGPPIRAGPQPIY